MKQSILYYTAIFLICHFACSGEPRLLEKTMSSSGIAIAEISSHYKFWDTHTNEDLGEVLPAQYQDLKNIDFVADWNSDGTKLALLFYYGTKSSQIFVYSKETDGRIRRVDFQLPDPLKFYYSTHGKTFDLNEASGADCNSLGPWSDNNVKLISGISKDVYDKTGAKNMGALTLLVSFELSLNGKEATLSNQKLIGPLSDADRDDFFKKWGDQYQ